MNNGVENVYESVSEGELQEVLRQLHDVLGQAEHGITIASVGGPSTWWGSNIAHNVPTLQGLEESCWKRRHQFILIN